MSNKAQKEYCDIMKIELSEREKVIFDGAYTFGRIDGEEFLKEKEKECEELLKKLGESINYVSFGLNSNEALDLFKEAFLKKKLKENK